MSEEIVTLHSAGPLPGIPGNSHAPGTYLVNWLERTITPVVQAVEAEVAHIEEAIHPDAESATDEPAHVSTVTPNEDTTTEALEHISEQVQQEP